jgi:predicted nucleic acid-binding protein
LSPAVKISATTLRKARRRIEQAPRAAERDLDDAVYLACAVDGGAHLITTEDSDLRSLGDEYEGVLILGWGEFREYLRRHGLTARRGK